MTVLLWLYALWSVLWRPPTIVRHYVVHLPVPDVCVRSRAHLARDCPLHVR